MDTNELLEKELTRVLDIKEETDQKLIKAYQQISELENHKNKITDLLVFTQIANLNLGL